MKISYSIIIPVFNRPEEIKELLDSFLALDYSGEYEVVIVEDGSDLTSEGIVTEYLERLNIAYYKKENTGPGDSRNFGMRKAGGNYFIILDSDCILPPFYLETVNNFLTRNYIHCFGGADRANEQFSPIQKAINYVMTSYLSTGGIRGNKKSISRFEPRSFNMGISKAAFEKTGGFSNIHPGEDPDLSIRMLKLGIDSVFIPNAFVYHKRRISWKKFYQQVSKFGLVRPILNEWHPESSKITYWFPSFFILFVLLSVFGAWILNWYLILPLGIYLVIILLDSTFKNKSVSIGLLSIFALFIQFFGYGLAFLRSTFLINGLKRKPQDQFPHLFFK